MLSRSVVAETTSSPSSMHEISETSHILRNFNFKEKEIFHSGDPERALTNIISNTLSRRYRVVSELLARQ